MELPSLTSCLLVPGRCYRMLWWSGERVSPSGAKWHCARAETLGKGRARKRGVGHRSNNNFLVFRFRGRVSRRASCTFQLSSLQLALLTLPAYLRALPYY